MTLLHPVTQERINIVAASGFKSELELADAILKFVSKTGKDLLEGGSLSEDETKGVKSTLNDTPIAFAALVAALTSLPLIREQKANLVFMLAKLMDDMLSLGATAMTAGSKDIASRVITGSSHGGFKGSKTRQNKQKVWQDRFLEWARELYQKNKSLTQEDYETKIRERWQSRWPPPEPQLPTRKVVIALISEAWKDGRLPKRTQ